MPVVSIRHLTRYRYRRPVAFGEHRMMFRPHESHDQRVLSSHVDITPRPTRLRHVEDVFGNFQSVATFGERSLELVFESHVRLEHSPLKAFADHEDELDARAAASILASAFAYGAEEMPDLRRSTLRDYPDPRGEVRRWARRFATGAGSASLPDLLTEMTGFIHGAFSYRSRLEAGTQTPQETLRLGSGSCRDFAVLMIEAVRSLRLAARYVSGYIYSPSRGAMRIGSAGGGHTHAWVRVYLPACGWVDFDPTNGIVGNKDLIRVAVARSPLQAVPLHGTWEGDARDYLGMDVQVDISTKERAGARYSPGAQAVAAA
jgi:transglutaminase-like putative cysteine protease